MHRKIHQSSKYITSSNLELYFLLDVIPLTKTIFPSFNFQYIHAYLLPESKLSNSFFIKLLLRKPRVFHLILYLLFYFILNHFLYLLAFTCIYLHFKELSNVSCLHVLKATNIFLNLNFKYPIQI